MLSQAELRIQANYTILLNETDYNLCRAYMPYDCHTYNEMFDLVVFDYKNPEHLKHAYDWEWFNNKDNERWEPTDLHTKTTLTAFPELADKTETKEFKKKWRYLGKSTNFAKLYHIERDFSINTMVFVKCRMQAFLFFSCILSNKFEPPFQYHW